MHVDAELQDDGVGLLVTDDAGGEAREKCRTRPSRLTRRRSARAVATRPGWSPSFHGMGDREPWKTMVFGHRAPPRGWRRRQVSEAGDGDRGRLSSQSSRVLGPAEGR